ncbi:LysE family translocator [Smaragdicoccus niigatensis]|uniref:LysE family translocator n=1 Tax=Smaragdicoccus niigatensis TaxID=359359 RepID=UPI000377FE6D|nr:LysE family translocator [Smaragdicoccus niigatensis]
MDTTTLMAFVAVDLLLVFTPGADWAYVIAVGLRDRSVIPAVAGLVVGYVGLTAVTVGGLAFLVAQSSTFLSALSVGGAMYLLWLGWGTVRSPVCPAAAAEPAVSQRRVMWRGAAISGSNPKALLLFLALFPQFIVAANTWPVAAQTAFFGLFHTVACALVYLAVGAFARTVLAARPVVARAVTRTSGAMMIAIGGLLLVEGVVA